MHCIRYASEAVPLGEDTSLPMIFGDQVLGRLSQRPLQGLGERRLRLTVVCMIRELLLHLRFPEDNLYAQNPMRNGSNSIPTIYFPYFVISFHL